VQIHLPASPQPESLRLDFTVRSSYFYGARGIVRTDHFFKTVSLPAGRVSDLEVPLLIPQTPIGEVDVTDRIQGWQVGAALFLTLAYTQLVLLLLLAPVFSAGALTIEKEQRTLGWVLTSLLRSTQIWCGKFAASLMFVLLLLVIGLPELSAVFAFGGVGPWEITIVALTTVIILGTLSAISLQRHRCSERDTHAPQSVQKR
jgi:hypothetical protein